ncbi:metallophosphoesterase family protein, partial [Planctomycetota bacterium]
ADPARVAQQVPLPQKITALVYPTIGCPSLVEPGGRLAPVLLLRDGGVTTDWRAFLRTAQDPVPQRYHLSPVGAGYDVASGTYVLAFDLPSWIPEDTFDLTVLSDGLAAGMDSQPNAVRVLRATSDFTFAHIADTQVGDPQTAFPQKFDEVLRELKLRDPAVTLFGGDVCFGTDYTHEYVDNWEVMRKGGLALAALPGNHDGYCWLDPQSPIASPVLDYDGLNFWRKTFGPTYYSFQWSSIRFVAINSYGGPTTRRNSLTLANVNTGGHVDPFQLTWIEQQAREATSLGQEMLVFLHHNPTKRVKPNGPAWPWNNSNVGLGDGTWNDAFSKQELLRIAMDHAACSWFFSGHSNRDEHKLTQAATGTRTIHHVNTTTPCNDGNPYEGYRLVKVTGGRIAEVGLPPADVNSVPFPLGGNLFLTYLEPNDGTASAVRAKVENLLLEPVDVTFKAALWPDPRGFRTSSGTIREVGVAETGAHVAYVRVTVPATGTVTVAVEPDPTGQGARPAFRPGASWGSTSGGCQVGPGGSGLAGLLLVTALACAVAFRVRREGP